AGADEGRGHLELAVDALLAQDRHARARAADERRRDVLVRVEREAYVEARVLAVEDALVLLLRRLRVVAQRLHAEARLRPGALERAWIEAREHGIVVVDRERVVVLDAAELDPTEPALPEDREGRREAALRHLQHRTRLLA